MPGDGLAKGFKFRLQPLLNVKKQMEDLIKNDMAKALKKLEEEVVVLDSMKKTEEKSVREFVANADRGIMAEKLREHILFISFLRENISVQKENVNLARNNVDKIREELVRIDREREILDKLKDKKFRLHMMEQSKKEQRLADEIVSSRYKRIFAGEANGQG